ncbi:sodium/calcium exchanger 1-like isoform X1 [Rhopilema esculentum]|uniref:sodium/calcium exchanger 1-like isoform X1 n=1 Tax=Rhopilema esculentum TaxID=499914 RepID=UPI0031DE067F
MAGQTMQRGALLCGLALFVMAAVLVDDVQAGDRVPKRVGNKTVMICENAERIKCVPGVILPSWGSMDDSKGAKAARAFIYMISLFFFFLGISIISDRFMASIEIITSQEKEIKVKDRATGTVKLVTVKIWNETVSNLTLMALGSSAPEILLSVIEIIGRNFDAGELGPSTIVGSAAFNLFMITAVCTSVIPDDEVRRIKFLRVFAFTSSAAIFAYIWMYLIISVFSVGVIEVWEGIFTLLCFPAFVGIAYMIDVKMNFYRFVRKKIRKRKLHGQTVIQTGDGDIVQVAVVERANGESRDVEKNHNIGESEKLADYDGDAYDESDVTAEDLKEMRRRLAMDAYHRAKQKAPEADSETLAHLVEQENLKLQHKSRAFYRIEATRKMTGSGSVLRAHERKEHAHAANGPKAVPAESMEMKDISHNGGDASGCRVFFHPAEYTVVESCGRVYLTLVRVGEDLFSTVYVDYKTVEGTANEYEDYEPVNTTLCFKPGETSKIISIGVVDDDIFELDEHFFVKLTGIRVMGDDGVERVSNEASIGDPDTAVITILDDDYPGVFTFEQDSVEVMETIGTISIKVIRLLGARSNVRVPYHTIEGSAKGGGDDYEDVVGEIEFRDEETSKTIDIPIIDREEYEKKKSFKVVISEPKLASGESQAHIPDLRDVKDAEMKKIIEAGKPTLGDIKTLEIKITECREFKNTIDKMLKKTNLALLLGTSSWREQFKEAVTVSTGDDEDEDAQPSYGDYVMHYITLFWKILFAFVPPTDMNGGWACFVVAISMIGILTAVTGDLASHFGCTVGLADSVVAISFVALGTSLPDTFASKVAALNDETADASVGNVQGSNAVNVFLGIGVAWSVASIYHTAKGSQFEVKGGSLGFSVLVFCCLALVCLFTMMWRRFNKNIGAELGGPQPYKKFTSLFFVMLWVTYILCSALETYCYIPSI